MPKKPKTKSRPEPVTPDQVVAMYGVELDEAGFIADIMNGESDGDLVFEDEPEPA